MIYLDHAATTPLHPTVKEELAKQVEHFGNPSSIYQMGRHEKQLLDQIKADILRELHADRQDQIIFTGSGSEANNTVVRSVVEEYQEAKGRLITSSIEHPSVRESFKWAETQGFEIVYLPVNHYGLVEVDDVKKALTPDTRLVSIMMVNNEVGSMQPLAAIGGLLQDHPAYFHTDAVQAFGQELIDVEKLHLDFLSASGHKINAPKGIGLLYKKRTSHLNALVHGGGQEYGLRAGTENTLYIKSFSLALAEMSSRRQAQSDINKNMIHYLCQELEKAGLDYEINAYQEGNASHVCNVWLKGLPSNQLLIMCDLAGVAVSAGSACSAGSLEPSPVLTAIFGKEDSRIHESIRLSFGLDSSLGDIDAFISAVIPLAKRLGAIH